MSIEHKYYGPHEVEKALKELNFDVNLPGYMPAGASRQGATIYTTNEHSSIVVRYAYGETGFYDLTFVYLIDPLESFVENDGDYSWVEIQINGKQALKGISNFSTEKRIIYKTDKNIYSEIYSPTLDNEEMIVILESI